MQTSLHDFFGKNVDCPHGPRKFVDLFCGGGGASTGAAAAGYEVVLAVDSWREAIECHKMNHPDAVHICAELPPTRPLPLPNDCVWHLHGSPPCTDISIAKHSPEHEIERALSLVWWFLNFALRSNATSWSMENVAVPSVMSVLREFRARNAQFRNQIDFEVFDFYPFWRSAASAPRTGRNSVINRKAAARASRAPMHPGRDLVAKGDAH